MADDFERLMDLLTSGAVGVALTGAGISIDSGIPAFRGAQGLWEKYDPMEFAHIDSFMANPGKVWGMLKEMNNIIDEAEPNEAHRHLAELERRGLLAGVITQNVDNLHQEAGSRQVVEFHGNGAQVVCLDCRKTRPGREVDLSVLPPRCSCGGLLKPDVVLFGEPIPSGAMLKAYALIESTQFMLVVATSAVVAPASMLPQAAKSRGATIVEINPEPTPLSSSVSDLIFRETAETLLGRVVQALGNQAG
jgi:NAD-dependent deacetylase